MRMLITLTEVQDQALDIIAKTENRSRASLIRSAIDDYIVRNRKTECDDAFGLWAERRIDGLAYQAKLRDW